MRNDWQTLYKQQGRGVGLILVLGLVCCVVGIGVAFGLYQTAGAIWAAVAFLSFVSGGVFLFRTYFQQKKRVRLVATMSTAADWLPQIRHRMEGGRLILPPAFTPVAGFVVLSIFAVFWNAIVFVFLYAGSGTEIGWFMILFMIPFVAAGLLFIGLAVRGFLVLFNPKIELSVDRAQASPGEVLHIHWQIEGRVERLKKLSILLTAEEAATYQRGTDTVTDRHKFQSIPVYESETIGSIGSAKVEIPRDAMHSFKSHANAIAWKLNVRGHVPRWPDIDSEYEILVVPRGLARG